MDLVGMAKRVVEFCYPGRCAGCGEEVREGSGDAVLCAGCLCEVMELEEEGACPRCAMPLVWDDSPCPYCVGKGLAPYEEVLRLSVFVEPVKEVVHQMKYHRRWGLAEVFAERLMGQGDIREVVEGADVIVPVPLYWRRQVKRGYNQSEVLARKLGKLGGGRKVVRAVRRVVDTASQTGMSGPTERWENVRGAFRLRRGMAERLRGKRVVVVDDVMTTGATLKAVGREVKKAGVAALSAVVVAIADPKGRGFEVI